MVIRCINLGFAAIPAVLFMRTYGVYLREAADAPRSVLAPT